MKYLGYLAVALTGCCLLPGTVQAQTNNRGLGNAGYGIFGDGTNLNGIYNGTGAAGTFRRNYAYNQNQIGNFGSYGGAYIAPLGAYGLGANGTGTNSVISPYLNLLRPGGLGLNGGFTGSGGRGGFYGGGTNGDWASSFREAERIGEEELRARQGFDGTNWTHVQWSLGYKQAEIEGEKEARRRAGENPEPEFRDWATSYKDQETQGAAKMEKDRSKSKQRAANLRQAKELAALEGELSGSSDSKNVAPPSLAMGLQSYHGPGYPSQIRALTHYYPSNGQPISRIGGR